MKLLQEYLAADLSDVDLVKEGAGEERKYYINGKFMQSEIVNRNGRIYPRPIIESQVDRYQNNISSGNSSGELGHPDTPQINLDRISHRITSLCMEGNDVIGKALILDTRDGRQARALLEGGVRLGVSSRGLGSLKERNGAKIVQEDFTLSTIDIVAEPSAPDAWVTGLMEEVDWVWDGSDWRKLEESRNRIIQSEFSNFLKSL